MNARKIASPTITISLEAARLIRVVYLPRNPNKVRNATPEVLAAVREFIDAVSLASGGR